MTKIAIMQPYFFPYAGYFQLIHEVDLFVFLDDVQYIRRGWINRNRINNFNKYLTIPIKKCPRDTIIKDVEISNISWVDYHLKIFDHIYGKNNINEYYSNFTKYGNLCQLLVDSIKWTTNLLDIQTNFEYSSNYPSKKFGKDRIIELCQKLNAHSYYNLPGGTSLYRQEDFGSIALNFIDTSHHVKTSILESILNGSTGNLRF